MKTITLRNLHENQAIEMIQGGCVSDQKGTEIFLEDVTDDKSKLDLVMAWCLQASSY